MSTMRLNVWEGTPAVEGAVDYSCGLKGRKDVSERRRQCDQK